MKIKPILFSTPMVRAILEGRKTQTRRTVVERNSEKSTAQWKFLNFHDANPDRFPDGKNQYLKVSHQKKDTRHRVHSKIQVGDILWVRESFRKVHHYGIKYEFYQYKAGGTSAHCEIIDTDQILHDDKWKPSIHMPKEACRIFLEVTDVRAERLQDISEEDAISEGLSKVYNKTYGESMYPDYISDRMGWYLAKNSFETLWKSINGKKSWKQNPWVWVYEFKQVEKPKNFLK